MSVSKEDREAYENGRKEAEFIKDQPISYLITGGIHSRPSDSSKAKAYDKGLREEQFDEGKSSNSSGCFLTTACVEYAGLPDDCYELQTMRRFRDEYIRSLPDAANLLDDYYQMAPLIVHRIKLQTDRHETFEHLLMALRQVVALVDSGHNSEALDLCKKKFGELRKKYSL